MNTEAEGEDERRFNIWFRINAQEPIMISGLTINTYSQVKRNDEYAYNFFIKCMESGKIMNNEPIEVLSKSIDNVDYTPVEYVPPGEQQLTELETLSDVTQDGTMLKVTYDYQGELYEVTESSEIHSKLQADKNFFAEFFQKGIERNIVQDNLGESYCSQINPDHTMPAQEDLNETPNDDENDSKFGWDHRSILFLLFKYSERLAKFRNPKIKKITLWREIEKEFHIIGISQVNAQMIDHKFRNLKATYKNIKNNNKKTGRGRQSWEWYQQMAEILENDKSVNFDTGIASMDDGAINLSQRRITSAHRLSLTSMSSFQNCYDNYDFTHIRSLSSSSNAFFLSHILSLSSSSDAFSDSDEEASADTPLNSNHLDAVDSSNSSHLDAGDSSNSSHLDAGDSSNSSHLNAGDCSCSLMPNGEPVSPGSAQSLTFSIPSEEIETSKSTRGKNLYSQRNRALQQEASKIGILQSIENKYDRIATALEHKNHLLQQRNEILKKRNELLESLSSGIIPPSTGLPK